MNWFEELTGFAELSPENVPSKVRVDGEKLTSIVNHRTFQAGIFTTPSLDELRTAVTPPKNRSISVAECVADVKQLHQDNANRNAVFQVASQFNCLEMVNPNMTPEHGVAIYDNDKTQGPACSISAGAGTIFRNYFAKVNGLIGQTRANQIDCLSELESYFGPGKWQMQNGYCLPSNEGLSYVEDFLGNCDDRVFDQLRGKLRVGVQAQTEVTNANTQHLVTQVFCSALPIAYSNLAASAWDNFPRLVLEATYESTFWVAVRNMIETGCNKLYLTLVGGGVFGNKLDWILSAIGRSLELFAESGLDIQIVSYRSSNPELASFIRKHNPG